MDSKVHGLLLTPSKRLKKPLNKSNKDRPRKKITYFDDCESFVIKNIILF